ncbi:MAG: hypothetical protein HY914_10975 [Desulfomonile tiedjei]|nr:hypothetical protein [Desulfomonile tiedjei]
MKRWMYKSILSMIGAFLWLGLVHVIAPDLSAPRHLAAGLIGIAAICLISLDASLLVQSVSKNERRGEDDSST